MLGQIVYSTIFRGSSFTSNGVTFALCNGQVVNRSTYADLSTIWPSGQYGSTNSVIVLPNFSAGYYFRGVNLGTSRDPSVASRTAPSGIGPTASTVGSFQTGAMRSHTHASGTVLTLTPTAVNGGEFNTQTSTTSDTSTGTFPVTSGYTASGTTGNDFDLNHHTFYPYIQIT
jgi:hypothetical protein